MVNNIITVKHNVKVSNVLPTIWIVWNKLVCVDYIINYVLVQCENIIFWDNKINWKFGLKNKFLYY